MKTLIKLPLIALGLALLLTSSPQKAMAQGEDVSLQSFYDELSPYGTWINDPQYGYVWRPDVDQREFRPYYTNGRWVMTEYGNTWVSNYDWGWAPFHYGRWIYNRYNEWLWLPDTVWGPAWVSWRSGGGYYGWAPLGPSIHIGINIRRGGYRIPDMCWNFVPYRYIYYNSYPRYYGSRNRIYIQNTVIINNTYVRNNRTYYSGPRAEEVRRVTNQDVRVYNLNRSNRPGAARIEDNTVSIYNPRPSRGEVSRGRNDGIGSNRGESRPDYNNTPDRRAGFGEVGSRPTRNNTEVNTAPDRTNNGRFGVAPNAQQNEISRPNENRDINNNQPQRSERNSMPQREERQQPAQPVQRMERPQQAPQRMERPQQQERVERPQQATPQRSRNSSENSEQGRARGESSSRPTRG